MPVLNPGNTEGLCGGRMLWTPFPNACTLMKDHHLEVGDGYDRANGSDDPKKDREIFLKILTMDDDGAWQRCKGEIPVAAWRDAASEEIRDEYFISRGFVRGLLSPEQQWALDAKRKRPVSSRSEFDAMPYAERLDYCERPENVSGPTAVAWEEINDHLGTHASTLPELVKQLGSRTYGHTPRVGDCFCGGGSIPFEAARIGCEAFGSDLNPVAGLLTWASLNLLGGSREVQEEVMRVQAEAFAAADRQITEWGIEHNEGDERADAYLYCVEVKPEGCEYYIPLSPTWLVGEKAKAATEWAQVPGSDRLRPAIKNLQGTEVASYKAGKNATVLGGRVYDPFDPNRSWSIESLRGPDGLRLWNNEDVAPRPGDVFQERLYCIRWVDSQGNRRYSAPDAADLAREAKVLELLSERFGFWQSEGFVPSKIIISGYNTEQPIRERGWTHWHHLYNPRQMLVNGLLAEQSVRLSESRGEVVASLLGVGRIANWNSRLCRWHVGLAHDKGEDVFSNQALNTLCNYCNRALEPLRRSWPIMEGLSSPVVASNDVQCTDAREVSKPCDLWITDPPYADAVNYHEISDFFLAWYERQLSRAFPDWIPDARAELAVRGNGEDFRRSMVEIYKNLANQMPDNGMQMVMFTHQDPAVWADLGMILWAAGLKATAAWTISTETEAAGIKKGNYVQGTVCLVLRKRISAKPGFLDEVYPLVEDEVKRQIASMQALDEGGEPNFNDADYQLAAYAAALKVLTQYGNLDGRDVEHEVFAVRSRNNKSDFETVIERALGIACDTLIPPGLDRSWRDLSLAERYYLRALDIESRGERRKGMYEELARGFGVTDIRPLLKSDKANGARMFTPSGLSASLLAPVQGAETDTSSLPGRRGRVGSGPAHPFAISSLRHLMFAIRETTAADSSPERGRQYLRDTFGQAYWTKRDGFIALLEWLAALGNAKGMNEWSTDSESARILAGRLRNDHA
jgi:putative DNA methylase